MMIKKIYVFGNGNLSWGTFHQLYVKPLQELDFSDTEFIIGDFTGADTLMMEFLKDKTPNVTILHMGKRPRYFANTFNTEARHWKTAGSFQSDQERDQYAISIYAHFLAADFNSDEKRIS
ncbi:hypothetical protein LF887_23620 [Chryseobacterium sp. MEBOG06]|uniref:hypothetical protein n=1 Tax=Chryseobacterium sp. MEBOG06 TaxID=2879938 RepID=UPI001F31AF34|nr:hypothetical protein [Chryseobacterium sp. MEBOG06]UKB83949.1 hypothetical protein LF887_23620 [Chryseobacterium sp. MEBOG06]